MVRQWSLLVCLLLLGAAATAQADSQDESVNEVQELLKSPYFVDGVHCNGLNEKEISESLLLAEEEIEITKKLEAQEDCEDLLKTFGVEKHTWMDPEDLERSSAKVRQSVYFEEASLAIKKSEIKHHIHIFLTVKAKSKFIYQVTNRSKVYSLFSRPRVSNRVSADMSNRAFQPNSAERFGFLLDTSFASEGLPLNNGQEALYSRNFYFTDFFYSHKRMVGSFWEWSFNAHFNLDNIYRVGDIGINFSADTDLIYSRYLRLLRGTIFIGPSAIYSPVYMNLTVSEPMANQGVVTFNSVTRFFPGLKVGYLYGSEIGTHIKTEWTWYHSVDDSGFLLQEKSKIQFDLGKNLLLNFFSNLRQSKSFLLARDKSPLSDAFNNNAGVGLVKVLGTSHRRTELDIRFGFEKLTYSPLLSNDSGAAFFGQLGYRLLTDTFNLDLSLGWVGSRIY